MHETDDRTPCRFGDCHAQVVLVLVPAPRRLRDQNEVIVRKCTNPHCRSNTGSGRPYERV